MIFPRLSLIETEWQALCTRGRRYGPQVTSTDLLKAVALITMLIDHLGFFFFPHEPMWRAVGRVGVPVWFFLAGYAAPTRFSWWLPLGALFLFAINALLDLPLFPLNILFSLMLIRTLVPLIPLTRLSHDVFLLIALPLLVVTAYFYTNKLFEYGALGLLLGIWGRFMREASVTWARALLTVACLASFLFLQQLSNDFKALPYFVMGAGTAATIIWLYVFSPRVYAHSESWGGFAPVIRFLGRHTLGIYVWHLTLLKFIHAWIQ